MLYIVHTAQLSMLNHNIFALLLFLRRSSLESRVEAYKNVGNYDIPYAHTFTYIAYTNVMYTVYTTHTLISSINIAHFLPFCITWLLASVYRNFK